MYHIIDSKYLIFKALLLVGSALMFVSCGGESKSVPTKKKSNNERLMTESSDNFTMVMTENGRPSYRFTTPRVEGYNLATEPYREFVKGVEIVTFMDDSLNMQDATLTANYAIYYEKRKLWEAMGDVVVKKSDGKELYSQQLFWNAQSKLIYSNVDTKILDVNTGDVYLGEGFESDESMKKWSFRKLKGRMKMEVQSNESKRDSLDMKNTDAIFEEGQSKGGNSNSKRGKGGVQGGSAAHKRPVSNSIYLDSKKDEVESTDLKFSKKSDVMSAEELKKLGFILGDDTSETQKSESEK